MFENSTGPHFKMKFISLSNFNTVLEIAHCCCFHKWQYPIEFCRYCC